LLVFWLGLTVLPFVLGISIVWALPLLFCNWVVIVTLAAAWAGLLGMGKGARIGRVLILGMWLAVEYLRFPFWPKDSWLWRAAAKIAGGDGIADIWQKLLILEVEWVTVIATLWLVCVTAGRPQISTNLQQRGVGQQA
jgi:hypothetical protein